MTDTTQTQPETNAESKKLVATPGQTIGPFYGFALPYDGGEALVDRSHPGAIRLHGTVYDGEGTPIPDSMLEIWQADEHGNVPDAPGSLVRDGYTFTGWGRVAVDNVGHYDFTTVNPGSIDGKAPFIALVVFARGLLNKLHTRIYLPEDEDRLAADPLLASLPEDRRGTLIATREPNGDLRFDIRMQGEGETVFLQFPNNPQ